MSDPRVMTADDLGRVTALLDDIFRRGNQVFDQTILTDFPLVFAPPNQHNCRVIEVAGEIVSHAAIWPCRLIVGGASLKLGIVVLVATHPDHRHQGFAACLMQDLQQTMRDEQYDLGVLWTSVPEFYRNLGWEVVRPRGWIIDDLNRHEVSAQSPPLGESVAQYDAGEHLDGIMRLHDQEPVRVARSRSEYAALLELPKIHVHVLVAGGDVQAYVVIGQAVNKRGLIEYGGSPNNVARLATTVVAEQSYQSPLPALLFHSHHELKQVFADAGASLAPLECSKGRGNEMILDVRGDIAAVMSDDLFFWGLDFT